MLNFFGNNTLVPNGYVYTSHTGSKYVFLEGLWFKNSSMGMVDPKSYNNMYVCAQKQINEHNSKSKIKIGETYLREGKNQIFIGEGRYTIDGLLVESQFSDFKKADPNKIEIPNRFKEGDYTYNKKEKAWYDRGEKVTDRQFAKELNTDAIKRINQYNSSDEFPVNSTVTYDGKKLTWNGTNWTDDYGTSYGDKFAAKVDEYIQDNPESSSNDSSTDPVQQDGEQPSNELKKGTIYTDKQQRRWVFDGTQFIDTQSGEPNPKSTEIVEYLKKNKGNSPETATKLPTPAEQTNSSEKTNSTDLSTQKMPKGTSFTSKSGIKYVYDGNGNFVSDKGKVYPPALTDQILAKYNAEQAQKEQESKKPEDEKIKNDIDSRVDDTSTADPEDKHEEEKADQEKAIDDNDAKVDDVEENDKIKSLADRIKANPKSRNIEVLLTRADKLSLMAADILLSGKADEVKKILQSLNSRDE
jgi:hypothetical protein